MAYTPRECSFIGRMTSRRYSRAQPLKHFANRKGVTSQAVGERDSRLPPGLEREDAPEPVAISRRVLLPFRGMRSKVRRSSTLVLTGLAVRAHRLAWDGPSVVFVWSLTFGGLRAVHPASLSEQSEERRPDPNAQHLAGVNHAR